MQTTIRQFMVILSTTVVMILLPAGNASAEISTFTGGDPGEGLDLEGEFIYALNFGETMAANDIVTVQDAQFLRTRNPAPVPPGVAYVASNRFDALPIGEYGSSTNDNNLEILLDSAVNADVVPDTISITLSNLVSQRYQLQLLMSPLGTLNRTIDIVVEGVTQDTVNVSTTTFGTDTGVVFTGLSDVSDGAMDIVLAPGAGAVNTPIISALTLKLVESIEISQVEVQDTALLCFSTVSGSVYRVEATPDLVSGVYTELGLTLTGDGQTNYLFDPASAAGVSTNRNYRVYKIE